MSAQEKLQKAIEAAIIAGYSLNSEAFEFLTENSENMDPEAVMNMALMQLAALQDKPMFIDRDRLVSVIHQLAVAEMQQAMEEQAEQEKVPQPAAYASPGRKLKPTHRASHKRSAGCERLLLPIRQRHRLRP